MEDIKNKVIEIEDYNGNTLMAFEIDEKGIIIKFDNCEIADIDENYIFWTKKDLMRIQKIEEVK